MFELKNTYNEIFEDFGFSFGNIRVYEEEKKPSDRKEEYIQLLGVFPIIVKKRIKSFKTFRSGSQHYLFSIKELIMEEVEKVKSNLSFNTENMDSFLNDRLKYYIENANIMIDPFVREEIEEYLLFFEKQIQKIKGGG